MIVDKDKAIQAWAAQNPFMTDALLFDFLNEHQGSCAISPIPGDAVVKWYIDSSSRRRYTFALQAMFAVSSATDTVNTDNMLSLRRWQDWLEDQEFEKNYPDFGEKCSDYRIENTSNMPSMAMRYESGFAKYQFMAQITYTEVMK